MDNDRGERRTLAVENIYHDVLVQHRMMLDKWMIQNKVAPSNKRKKRGAGNHPMTGDDGISQNKRVKCG